MIRRVAILVRPLGLCRDVPSVVHKGYTGPSSDHAAPELVSAGEPVIPTRTLRTVIGLLVSAVAFS